ncbi:MAG: hypothetical protein ACP5ON_06740 [Bacteroidota bacterium]
MIRMRFLVTAFMVVSAITEVCSQSTAPGSFTTIGYGARAISMGNALTALGGNGALTPYNPALAAPLGGGVPTRNVTLSVGILTLDRSLDFLSFTQPLKPHAGLAVGILHAGVSRIDGRDADGVHTVDYSTSENQIYFSFANQFAHNLAIGVSLKLYYYKLFDKLSSTTAAIDLGATYFISDALTVGIAVTDINAKYKWDTSSLYGQSGASTVDNLPVVTRIGTSYRFPVVGDIGSTIAAAFEFTNTGRRLFRIGTEVAVVEGVFLRGGVDRISLHGSRLALPSLGFGVGRTIASVPVAFDYAYVFEPYNSGNMHVLTLSFQP